MSALEDKPAHFVDWLQARQHTDACLDQHLPLSEQFVPRYLYGHYLQQLLNQIHFDASGQNQIKTRNGGSGWGGTSDKHATLLLDDQRKVKVE